MTDENTPETRTCPVCGMPNTPEAAVCERCGIPLARPRAVDAPEEPLAAASDTEPAGLTPELPTADDAAATRAAEPRDQGVEPFDQGVEPLDQGVEPLDQGVEPLDRAADRPSGEQPSAVQAPPGEPGLTTSGERESSPEPATPEEAAPSEAPLPPAETEETERDHPLTPASGVAGPASAAAPEPLPPPVEPPPTAAKSPAPDREPAGPPDAAESVPLAAASTDEEGSAPDIAAATPIPAELERPSPQATGEDAAPRPEEGDEGGQPPAGKGDLAAEEPVGVTAGAAPAEAAAVRRGDLLPRAGVFVRRQLRGKAGRVLLGAIIGLLVLIVLLAVLPGTPQIDSGASTGSQAAVPTPTPQPAVKATAPPSASPAIHHALTRDVRVLGAGAGLSAPQEAVQLRNGTIAVVDTGHKRLVFLDAGGAVMKSVTAGAGPLKEPFAVAAAGDVLYVLDSSGDTIERFTAQGRYAGTVLHDPVLDRARGLTLGRNGTLLVANPASNSVLTLAADGSVLHTVGGPVGSGPSQLNQPSDVAAGPNGATYILDNNNQRVQILNAAGSFTGRLPAPQSSTIASAHVLPLPDGRLVVSDPTGALLVYSPGGSAATRVVLQVKADPAAHISPLGLSLGTGGRVLVTDTAGNRILVIPTAQL